MSKFVFKLEALLNLKKQLEDSLKNELGKAVQKLEHEKKKLGILMSERENLVLQFNKKSIDGIAAGKLREYGSYLAHIKEKMEHQKENINYAQSIVDKYREQLVKAVQEKEMLEKLKDKKYQEFIKDQKNAEQKSIDEIVSYKHNKILAGVENG